MPGAITSTATLGLGRVGIRHLITIADSKLEDQSLQIVGRKISQTQESELIKQLSAYGPAELTLEGESVKFDARRAIHQRYFSSKKRTKGAKYTIEAWETDQYGVLAGDSAWFAKSFRHAVNQDAADLDNLGFSATTAGMNSETLYSTSHSMGAGVTFSNTPAAGVGFGPAGIKAMLINIRKQRDARNLPMTGSVGKVLIKVPVALEFDLAIILKSMEMPGTPNNDSNVFNNRIAGFVCDYYTSDTAWFARLLDDSSHGLFQMTLKEYTPINLGPEDDMTQKLAVWKMWTHGWWDAHGTFGTAS